MTSKLLPQPPAHGPLGRTRPQEFSLGHGHCSPLPPPEGAPTCPAPVTACQGPSACSKPFPCVEVGFVCSVQACAAASAGVSVLGPPPPSLSRHWHRLTRLEGQGEIWGPVPQQGHLEKQAALSFLPCQPLPPAFPGASIISWRKLCSNESYLSPSPSREHGAHSWDQETDRRDGEQGVEPRCQADPRRARATEEGRTRGRPEVGADTLAAPDAKAEAPILCPPDAKN